MPPYSLALLLSRPPFSTLQSLFPALTHALSATLIRQASTLARVVHPHTNASYIHRAIPTLASSTASLQQAARSTSASLSRSRQRAAHELAAHLAQHARALAALLRVLEAKHGPAARSAALRAEHAALNTRTLAVAAEARLWGARRAAYPPAAQRALGNYRRHLGGARRRVADTMRVREAELEEYGVDLRKGRGGGGGGEGGEEEGGGSSKERTMREVARVWREMEGRLAEVRGDLERLG